MAAVFFTFPLESSHKDIDIDIDEDKWLIYISHLSSYIKSQLGIVIKAPGVNNQMHSWRIQIAGLLMMPIPRNLLRLIVG